MIVFGYVKDYMYAGDGTLLVKTRIPAIHGPYSQSEYRGKPVRNFTSDGDLPYYPSVLLPHLPCEGEVVMLSSTNDRNSDFVILGLTGGSYFNEISDNVGGR